MKLYVSHPGTTEDSIMPDENQAEIVLIGRLNGNQRNRLAKLLNMMYRPSELAEEVGFEVRQVYRVYIPLGLKHERDSRRHIWINGIVFKNWVKDIYKKRTLSPNEAFCLTCKKAVVMRNPIKKSHNLITYYECACPNCDRKLARIIRNGRKKNDQ